MKELNIKAELSNRESMLLRAIYDFGDEVSTPDLIRYLGTDYGKEYARTTVVTFLQRMRDKGFVTIERRGRIAYIHPVIPREEYLEYRAVKDCDFWYKGDAVTFVKNIIANASLTDAQKDEIRQTLS